MMHLLLFVILSTQLVSSYANPAAVTTVQPNTEPNLCPCVSNATETTPPSKFPSIMVHGMTCICHANNGHPYASRVHRDDYKYSPGIGAHKLHTRATTWNEARKMCNEEGAHLAVVNSLTEEHIMMELFAKAGPVKGASYDNLAYIGIHDLFKEGEWVTVLGESLFKTGYTNWSDKWGGQPDNGSDNQNCGGFMKEGGLDDVNCDAPFAFFCEIPITYNV